MGRIVKLVYDVNEASGNRIWDGVLAFGRPVFHKTVPATGWAALLHSADNGANWTETEITNLGQPSPSSPVDTLAVQALTPAKLIVAESGAAAAAVRAAWTEDLTAFTIETLLAGNPGVTPDLGLAQDIDVPTLVNAFQLNTDVTAPIQNPFRMVRDSLGWIENVDTLLNVSITAVATGKIPATFPPPNFLSAPWFDQSNRLRYLDTNSVPPIPTDFWNPAGGTINYLRWWENQGRLISWERTLQRARAIDPSDPPPPDPTIIWGGQLLGQISDMVEADPVLYILTLDDGGVTGMNIRLYRATSISAAPSLLATIVQANTLVFSPRLVVAGGTFYIASFVNVTNRVRVHKVITASGGLRKRR